MPRAPWPVVDRRRHPPIAALMKLARFDTPRAEGGAEPVGLVIPVGVVTAVGLVMGLVRLAADTTEASIAPAAPCKPATACSSVLWWSGVFLPMPAAAGERLPGCVPSREAWGLLPRFVAGGRSGVLRSAERTGPEACSFRMGCRVSPAQCRTASSCLTTYTWLLTVSHTCTPSEILTKMKQARV